MKIVYLASTSRLLERLASVAVKGQSASGKSWVVQRVRRASSRARAYYEMTAASEHALVYDDEPLAHRMLVIYEASGLESDKFSYIVRSLLSEGRLRYPTVHEARGRAEDGDDRARGPDRADHHHHRAPAPPARTRPGCCRSPPTSRPSRPLRCFEALAEEEDGANPTTSAGTRCSVGSSSATARGHDPLRQELAKLVPPVAVRLRRDFGSVLALIRAHALLHQATRERDGRGRIVATIDDYEVVRELRRRRRSPRAVEKTVKPQVREVVEKVREIVGADPRAEVKQRQLAEALEHRQGPRLAATSGGARRRLSDQPRGPQRQAAQTRSRRPAPRRRADPSHPRGVARLRSCLWGLNAPPPPSADDADRSRRRSRSRSTAGTPEPAPSLTAEQREALYWTLKREQEERS